MLTWKLLITIMKIENMTQWLSMTKTWLLLCVELLSIPTRMRAIKRIRNLTQNSLDFCSKYNNHYFIVQQDIILHYQSHSNCHSTVITWIPVDRFTIIIFNFLILLVIAQRQLVLTRRIVIDSWALAMSAIITCFGNRIQNTATITTGHCWLLHGQSVFQRAARILPVGRWVITWNLGLIAQWPLLTQL